MPQVYETVDETHIRLGGSVFLYDNQPCFCDNVYLGNDGKPWLKLLLYPEMATYVDASLNDPKLEFRRYNLGYMNTPDGASFVARLPARGRYKQGLCKENVAFSGLVDNAGGKYVPRFDNFVHKPAFRDMLTNTYPSMTEAAERLKADRAKTKSVAFDRYFAIAYDTFRRDYLLMYKGERVAFGQEPFEVGSEFTYLREVFLKHGIKIR